MKRLKAIVQFVSWKTFMRNALIGAGVAIGLIGAFIYVVSNNHRNDSSPGQPQAVEEKQEEYVFKTELADVTEGNDIRSINTQGKATGLVRASYSDGQYSLEASFFNLPKPREGGFYEGWIVASNPHRFQSTGELAFADGVYVNEFVSGVNFSEYQRHVLQIRGSEHRGSGPSGNHILEGGEPR